MDITRALECYLECFKNKCVIDGMIHFLLINHPSGSTLKRDYEDPAVTSIDLSVVDIEFMHYPVTLSIILSHNNFIYSIRESLAMSCCRNTTGGHPTD